MIINVQCRDRVQGRVVRVRLRGLLDRDAEVPEWVPCTWSPHHEGAHGATVGNLRVWWWRWGNERLQLRGKELTDV